MSEISVACAARNAANKVSINTQQKRQTIRSSSSEVRQADDVQKTRDDEKTSKRHSYSPNDAVVLKQRQTSGNHTSSAFSDPGR